MSLKHSWRHLPTFCPICYRWRAAWTLGRDRLWWKTTARNCGLCLRNTWDLFTTSIPQTRNARTCPVSSTSHANFRSCSDACSRVSSLPFTTFATLVTTCPTNSRVGRWSSQINPFLSEWVVQSLFLYQNMLLQRNFKFKAPEKQCRWLWISEEYFITQVFQWNYFKVFLKCCNFFDKPIR